MVDWSYDLLAVDERVVLRRLALFRGSFTLEAAEAVCSGTYESIHADANADASERATINADTVLDHLTRLVDKSLAQFHHETGRYRLLETIRLYGLQRLADARETNFASRQHFVYYLQLAEDGATQINSPNHVTCSARLEYEHDNLRAALAWALDAERTDEAARLALGLWRFWRAKTYQREGLRWLQHILEQSTVHPLPPTLHPRLLNALGVLASAVHRFAEADTYQREALHLWTEAGDRAGIAQALIDIGWLHFDQVELAQTKQCAVEALPLAEATGDQRLIASALMLDALADLHGDFGMLFDFGPAKPERAAALLRVLPTLERSAAIWRAIGDAGSEASALALAGLAYQGTSDFERAKPLLAGSARLHVRLGDSGDHTGVLVALMNLAANLAARGAEGAERQDMARDSARMFGVLTALNTTITSEPSPWDSAEPVRKLQAMLAGVIGEDGFEQALAEGKTLTTAAFLALVDRITAPAPYAATRPSPPPTPPAAPIAGLTARETEVLRLVARGMTNAQVARELTITPRTVNAHLTAIYGKLGVASRAGAIRYAIEHHDA
jgi:non-specific serine/threonine protein kinase